MRIAAVCLLSLAAFLPLVTPPGPSTVATPPVVRRAESNVSVPHRQASILSIIHRQKQRFVNEVLHAPRLLAAIRPVELVAAEPAVDAPVRPWLTESAQARLAAAYLAKLPYNVRHRIRFLTTPEEESALWASVLDWRINSFSRRARLQKLVRVTKTLLAVDLQAYGLDPLVWDQLANVDVYNYLQGRLIDVLVTAQEEWQGGIHPVSGKYEAPGTYTVKRWTKKFDKSSIVASWIDPVAANYLTEQTQSKAPVVRGDFFLRQSSQQFDRNQASPGYREFLGTKNRADFHKLIGLDRELADRFDAILRAIADRSGVAINGRQIEVIRTLGGYYWVTLDNSNSRGRKNPKRNLGNDFEHEAEEHYSSLPNRLLAKDLSDAKGQPQASVPDAIAGSRRSGLLDTRIHLDFSCERCHTTGILDIDDFARKTFKLDNRALSVLLADPDEKRLDENQRRYLGRLDRAVKEAKAQYAEAVQELTGEKPETISKAFYRLRSEYAEADLYLADVAREMGYTVKQIEDVLLAEARTNPPLDTVLAGLLVKPEALAIRRESWEELYSTVQLLISKHLPAKKR
jgi:hypothetical protein